MSMAGVEFTKEELKQLIEDENSCVHLKKSEYSLALFPCHLENFNDSIKELLNQKKAKYVKELGGILLGYRNIKLLSNDGAIVNDSCYIHIDIEADFYIFKPEKGSVLKGVVNKVSDNHLGCLVHRLFNISVPKQELNQGDDWFGYYVDLGHEVILNVTHIDLHSRLPYIRANLDDKQFQNTSAMKSRKNQHNEDISNKEITETPVFKKEKRRSFSESLEEEKKSSKKKKHKKSKERVLDETDNGEHKHKEKTELPEVVENGDIVHKKHKKDKHQDSIHEEIEIKHKEETKIVENGDGVHKKHKKKHKSKDKDLDTSIEIKKEKKNKKDKRKSQELLEQKQIKDEHNLSIKRESLNGSLKADLSFNSLMADFEDRKSKKKNRNSKTFNVSVEDVHIKLDSDLEKILNESSKKKKKKHKDKEVDEVSETIIKKVESIEEVVHKSKKRKREEEHSDELEYVKKHKKKKRHSVTEET